MRLWRKIVLRLVGLDETPLTKADEHSIRQLLQADVPASTIARALGFSQKQIEKVAETMRR